MPGSMGKGRSAMAVLGPESFTGASPLAFGAGAAIDIVAEILARRTLPPSRPREGEESSHGSRSRQVPRARLKMPHTCRRNTRRCSRGEKKEQRKEWLSSEISVASTWRKSSRSWRRIRRDGVLEIFRGGEHRALRFRRGTVTLQFDRDLYEERAIELLTLLGRVSQEKLQLAVANRAGSTRR